MKTIVVIILILAGLGPSAFSAPRFTPDPMLLSKADSVFSIDSKEQLTFVDVIEGEGEDPSVYFAATFKTIPYPVDSILNLLMDVESYHRIFGFIKKSVRAKETGGPDASGTYFIEAAVMLARSWFLGDLDSISHDSSGRLVTSFRKNHDSTLNAQWREKRGGILTVEYREFTILGYLKDLENGTTRTAMIACVAPDIWIPRWLFRMVSKFVFPSLLRDIEKKLEEMTLPERQQ